jgi:hypothetical protein
MADWYVSSVAYAALPAWAATTAYTVGQIIRPTTAAIGTHHVLRCTTAGTSAASEPTWAVGNNATTTSNTAVFTNVGGQSAYGWGAASGSLLTIGRSRVVVGDRVFLSSDHSESGNASWDFNNLTSAFGLIQLISVNRAGSVPPVAADILNGASITNAAGANFQVDAHCNLLWQGITFTSVNGFAFNTSATKSYYFKNCAFVLSAVSNATFRTAAPCKIILDNTTIQFGHIGQVITAGTFGQGELSWINTPNAIIGATLPTFLFSNGGTSLTVTCRGVDLSAIVGTLLKTASAGVITKVLLDSCKIAPGVTRYALTSTTGDPAYDEIELVNCFDGTNIINERHTAAGDVITDATTTLSGGTRDNVGGYSHKLVSSARSDVCTMPLDGFWLDVGNTGVGVAKTATVEIVSSAVLNNNDIKLQLEYMGISGSALASFGESLASMLTAAAALPSSSASWNNPPSTPQKQFLQVSFTPQTAGRVKGLVRLGKPSTTVWVNPQVAVAAVPQPTSLTAALFDDSGSDAFYAPAMLQGVLLPALLGDSDTFYAAAVPLLAWTPASLATLKGWYKADALSGVDASNVTSWPDSSGLGNNAAGVGPTIYPLLQTAEQNSLNVVEFDFTTGQCFNLPNLLAGATAAAAIFVLKTIATGHGCPLKIGTDTQESHYPYSDNNIYDDFASNARKSVGNPGTLTSWHIASFHSTNGSWKYYRNGVLFFSTASNTFAVRTTSPAPLIGSSFSATFLYSGMIGEGIIVNEFLSDADRQKAEGYAAWKWGLVASLDVSHPYKSAAP